MAGLEYPREELNRRGRGGRTSRGSEGDPGAEEQLTRLQSCPGRTLLQLHVDIRGFGLSWSTYARALSRSFASTCKRHEKMTDFLYYIFPIQSFLCTYFGAIHLTNPPERVAGTR